MEVGDTVHLLKELLALEKGAHLRHMGGTITSDVREEMQVLDRRLFAEQSRMVTITSLP